MRQRAIEVVCMRNRLMVWVMFLVLGCGVVPHAALAGPPQYARAFVSTTYSRPPIRSERLITVLGPGNFPASLESAQPGDIVELEAGAIRGNSVSNSRETAWVQIRSFSPGSIANNDGRIYTVVPPGLGITAGSDVTHAAAHSDYGALLTLYSQEAALDDVLRWPSGVIESPTARRGWPMRGHDPANTGHTDAQGPTVGTQPVWTFRPDPNTFVWRPAVAPDGTIYVTTALFLADGVDGRLYALRPDGSVKWQTELTNSTGLKLWTSATPVIDVLGNIYVAWAHDREFGSLTAISLDNTGKVRWRFEPKVELETASHQQPVLGQRALYAAIDTSFTFGDTTRRASIFALDLATGRAEWRWVSPNFDTFLAGPAVGLDGLIYYGSSSNPLRGASAYLYRIQPNGVLDWSVNIGVGVPEPPAIDSQNGIYLGDETGVARKYNSSGSPIWKYDTMSGQIAMSPVLNGGRVMVGALNAGLHLLDARTGQRDAVFAPEEYPMSQASDRAGNAFFYSFDPEGTVFGFGARGRQWWSFATGGGSTVNAVAIAADGKLLVSNSQTLKAYIGRVLGDLNCDGGVNAFDIGPFILAFADPPRYAERYPGCSQSLADINGDGAVDVSDIGPFISLLD